MAPKSWRSVIRGNAMPKLVLKFGDSVLKEKMCIRDSFDTGKADVKPESDATLQEVAKLLKGQPSLKVYVVGHTDNEMCIRDRGYHSGCRLSSSEDGRRLRRPSHSGSLQSPARLNLCSRNSPEWFSRPPASSAPNRGVAERAPCPPAWPSSAQAPPPSCWWLSTPRLHACLLYTSRCV